jgi:hypothetical protein
MKVLGTTLAILLGLLFAPAANAGEECCGAPDACGRCGCHAACQKYCKTVPDVKEIKKTVWVVKCEDFCAPLPGLPCGRHGACGADGCQEASCDNGNCGSCQKCGHVRTKKTLEKKEVTCKIPCWKCVVVYACGGCGDGCVNEGLAPVSTGEPTSAAPLPPAPRRPLPPPPPKSARQGALDYEPRLTLSTGY